MAGAVSIRFYEELNDFLPLDRRNREFKQAYREAGSIKDLIESIGVPHVEIDLILINGQSVGFAHRVADGDHISVYPVFESLDVSPICRLRPEPLRETRFVLDNHLGRLAAYLRMLGFDTLYRNDYDDPTLAGISTDEQRVLLTCDRQLLMRAIITRGYFVRSRKPREQLGEVVARLDLMNSIKSFSRCMHCNALTEAVDKSEVEERLLPRTRELYTSFKLCPGCGRIYWKGTHYQRMRKIITELKQGKYTADTALY